MVYRTMTLTNGDTVRVTESVLRGQGPEGKQGPVGPPGAATTIRGHVPTAGSLPSSGRQGDGYITDDTGHLWTWDMILSQPQWVDCGRIVGPAGNLSIGAMRSRIEEKALLANNGYAVEYTQTPYNDVDPLAGKVLDETKSTSTSTVVSPATDVYHLVTTKFIINSDVEGPVVVTSWRNAQDSTIVSSKVDETFEWELSPGVEGDVIIDHIAVLKTNNQDLWQFVIKASANVTISALETIWTRLGGGQGPEGATGPAPDMYTGTVTTVPYGQPATYVLTETSPGVYRVDVGLPQGAQGIAGSGYSTFNQMISTGLSESDPGGLVDYATDQQIPIPDGERGPAIPYYLTLIANNIFRKLVSRVTTAQKTARGNPPTQPGEVVYDSDLKQFQGVQPNGAANAWFIIPTMEYGQSSSVYHGASTVRPNGSLYFKHE